jgi:hypothetical protein
MKKSLIITLIVTICLSACKKDALPNDYDKSYSAWLSFKQANNNSYSYTTINGSVVSGVSGETRITVNKGVIIARDYTSYKYSANATGTGSVKTILSEWHEDKTSLNTHGNVADQLLTLDDVYKKAKNEWLTADKKNNDIFFEATINGMISTCGYRPKGCQDDCTVGINIWYINAL